MTYPLQSQTFVVNSKNLASDRPYVDFKSVGKITMVCFMSEPGREKSMTMSIHIPPDSEEGIDLRTFLQYTLGEKFSYIKFKKFYFVELYEKEIAEKVVNLIISNNQFNPDDVKQINFLLKFNFG